MKTVGIDVSKSTLDICCLTNQTNQFSHTNSQIKWRKTLIRETTRASPTEKFLDYRRGEPTCSPDNKTPLSIELVNATGFVLETGFQQNSSRNAHLPLPNTLLPNTPLPEQQPPMVQSTAAKPMVLPPTMAPFPPPIIRTEDMPPVQTNESLVLRPPSFGTTTKEASPFLKPSSPSSQGQEKSNPFTQKKPPFQF
jgi:hypothetical protein